MGGTGVAVCERGVQQEEEGEEKDKKTKERVAKQIAENKKNSGKKT